LSIRGSVELITRSVGNPQRTRFEVTCTAADHRNI
jgi:hypothetical protein